MVRRTVQVPRPEDHSGVLARDGDERFLGVEDFVLAVVSDASRARVRER